MKRAFLREHGKTVMELIEEAFVTLRTCPAGLLATYYAGTVPFAAGLLVFCSDLSRNPEAPHHLGGATLVMTGLYIWMKFFQARFGVTLLARLRGEPPPPLGVPETLRTAGIQTILHGTALFLLPLAGLLILPFGWVCGFYQNATLLDDGRTRLRQVVQSSAQQSALWPGQNHGLLFVLSGFGLFVFLNWITLCAFVPELLKMFFGIESVFTQRPSSLFNTTFFAATGVMTYLSIDPLTKTCYALRCFYGKSLKSGDDLKTDARRLAGKAAALAACLLFLFTAPAPAAETAPTPAPAVGESELNRSIDTVIQQDKYLWRRPKEAVVDNREDGPITRFLKSIEEMRERLNKRINAVLEKILDWLFGRDRSAKFESGASWLTPQLGLLFVILTVAACVLGVAGMRILRARRDHAVMEGTAIPTAPDLEDESVAADDRPEDDWTRMGRQLLEQGDARRALRAFYLASLAHLAGRNLITIARFKSNRDYERELRRRGHAMPELPALFGENVSIFARTWYGWHEATKDMVERFLGNLEKIKAAT